MKKRGGGASWVLWNVAAVQSIFVTSLLTPTEILFFLGTPNASNIRSIQLGIALNYSDSPPRMVAWLWHESNSESSRNLEWFSVPKLLNLECCLIEFYPQWAVLNWVVHFSNPDKDRWSSLLKKVLPQQFWCLMSRTVAKLPKCQFTTHLIGTQVKSTWSLDDL